MSDKTSAAPCRCIPDSLIAAVAELAAVRGDTFDETLTSLIYIGLCTEDRDDNDVQNMDLLKLSRDIDAELENGPPCANCATPCKLTSSTCQHGGAA